MIAPVTPPLRSRKNPVRLGLVLAIATLAVTGCTAAPNDAPVPSWTPAPEESNPPELPTDAVGETAATAQPVPEPEPRCTLEMLDVTVGAPDPGAGTTRIPLVFTNTDSERCALAGFPGVSIVGGGDGSMLGAAAVWESATPVEVQDIAPGAAVTAMLSMVSADALEGCEPTAADGFRVYPPHGRDAIFLPMENLLGCTNASAELLRMDPVTAG